MDWAVAMVGAVVADRLAAGPTTLAAAGCWMGAEARAIIGGSWATTAIGGWLLVADEEDKEVAAAPRQRPRPRLTPDLEALVLRFSRLLRYANSALRYSLMMPRRAVLLVVCLHDCSMPSTSCVNTFESCTALVSTISTFSCDTFGCLRGIDGGTDGGAAGGAMMRLSGGRPEPELRTSTKVKKLSRSVTKMRINRNHSITKKENKRPLTRERRLL